MEPYLYYADENGELQHKINPDYEVWRKNEMFNVMLKYSGIPSEYHTLGFSAIKGNYKKSKLNFKHCVKYAINPDDPKFKDVSLYLYGPNSSSKTSVACAIGMGYLKCGKYVRFITANELVELMIERVSWKAEDEVTSKLKDFEKCDLIIIDDAFDSKKSLIYETKSKNQIVQMWDGFLRRNLSNHTRFVVTSNEEMEKVLLSYSKDIYEQLNRNFYKLEFLDDITNMRKSRFEGIWD